MKRILRYITNALLVIGLILVFWGVGLDDEYVLKLGQEPPEYVWKMIWSGAVLMLPAIVRMLVGDIDV